VQHAGDAVMMSLTVIRFMVSSDDVFASRILRLYGCASARRLCECASAPHGVSLSRQPSRADIIEIRKRHASQRPG
jgi:hypothetical protein